MNNRTQIIKLAAITIFAIAIFAVGVFAFNRFYLSLVTGGTQNLQPITTVVNFPPAIVEPMGFTSPTFTVIDQGIRSEIMPTHYLSSEVAAHIVAMYVWDVFDMPLDGTTVIMGIESWVRSYRTYWSARILDLPITPPEEGEWQSPWQTTLVVTIDAVTGERISIEWGNYQHPPRCYTITDHDIALALYNRDRHLRLGYPDPMMQWGFLSHEFGDIAIAYARRHLGQANALWTNVQWAYLGAEPAPTYTRDTRGNVVFGNYIIPFHVTIDGGPRVYVAISYASRQVVSISTVRDIFIFEPPQIDWMMPPLIVQTPPQFWEPAIVPALPPLPVFPPPRILATLDEHFTQPQIEVYMSNWMANPPEAFAYSVLPMERAAVVAAIYIGQLFGFSLDGLAVEFNFSGITYGNQWPVWNGIVQLELHERNEHGYIVWREFAHELFSFALCAFTGELLSLTRFIGAEPTICPSIEWEEISDMWQRAEVNPFPNIHDMAPAEQFVRHITRHIGIATVGGRVTDITYVFSEPINFARNKNGDIIATAFNMFFDVQFMEIVDNRPALPYRNANIRICSNTGELVWLFVHPLDGF